MNGLEYDVDYIRAATLAKRLGVCRATIYNWVNKGILPRPMKVSDRVTVWRLSDVQAAMDKIHREQVQ